MYVFAQWGHGNGLRRSSSSSAVFVAAGLVGLQVVGLQVGVVWGEVSIGIAVAGGVTGTGEVFSAVVSSLIGNDVVVAVVSPFGGVVSMGTMGI